MAAQMTEAHLQAINEWLQKCAEDDGECERLIDCGINALPEKDKIASQAVVLQKIKAMLFPDRP